ncbi:MAG: pirin family protein [Clostridia bacterium]|nr:pirin family protein [Clostridia bacterium]
MSIILNRYKAKQVVEGGGVVVNRVFGNNETKEFDPFLMLDYFKEDKNRDLPGFPWHPHKGMETITYLLKGSGEHEDSIGSKGVISAGELQWMSAGKGIMHQEMLKTDSDGIQGFQFWINLKSTEKNKSPEYQYIRKGEMKQVNEAGSTVNIISGEYKGQNGPIDKSDKGITLLHVILEEGAEISLSRDKDKQGFIFVFEGSGKVADKNTDEMTAYTLAGGELKVKAQNKMQFIYAEGTPLNEPIFWYGPVVMNTREEIIQAFTDIETNNFV